MQYFVYTSRTSCPLHTVHHNCNYIYKRHNCRYNIEHFCYTYIVQRCIESNQAPSWTTSAAAFLIALMRLYTVVIHLCNVWGNTSRRHACYLASSSTKQNLWLQLRKNAWKNTYVCMYVCTTWSTIWKTYAYSILQQILLPEVHTRLWRNRSWGGNVDARKS